MTKRYWWCGWTLWLTAFSSCVLAQPQVQADALQWLARMQQAAQRLNYSGTYVYLQLGGQPQTSRITHVIDGAGERERLEVLDGASLVVVRRNDEVRSYLADSKTVVVEKRSGKAGFPALLTDPPGVIMEQYEARKGDVQRVAGVDCQSLILESRDRMRYSHRLWADINSGLLLKVQALNDKGDVVEQVAFTQLEIGGPAERYSSRVLKRDGGRDWKVVTPPVSQARFADAGWRIDSPMPGFRKVLELRRGIGSIEVGQVVFSDGLAAVSVFLEPLRSANRVPEGLSSQGPVNVYRRIVADHVVTVLGEAPAACVTRIAQAIEFKPASKP
jgi:sigma-E factor negative regulatory protein RseB